MKKRIYLTTILMTLGILAAACGTQTSTTADAPQTLPEPVSPTEAVTTPTEAPAAAETNAPADASASSAAEAPASTNVSYLTDIAPILDTKCIRCHGGQFTREGLDLRTYENILKGSRNGTVLVPGNANESLFVQLIVEGEMPSRGNRVTPQELQLIIEWVNQGALNN